jgi:hypothetical protein
MADMFRVLSQNLQTELNPNGQGFVTVWQVRYEVTSGPAKGTQGQVNVPASQFNAEMVKQAIDAAVYHLDQVAGL